MWDEAVGGGCCCPTTCCNNYGLCEPFSRCRRKERGGIGLSLVVVVRIHSWRWLREWGFRDPKAPPKDIFNNFYTDFLCIDTFSALLVLVADWLPFYYLLFAASPWLFFGRSTEEEEDDPFFFFSSSHFSFLTTITSLLLLLCWLLIAAASSSFIIHHPHKKKHLTLKHKQACLHE